MTSPLGGRIINAAGGRAEASATRLSGAQVCYTNSVYIVSIWPWRNL